MVGARVVFPFGQGQVLSFDSSKGFSRDSGLCRPIRAAGGTIWWAASAGCRIVELGGRSDPKVSPTFRVRDKLRLTA